jgi:TnpA family transposase
MGFLTREQRQRYGNYDSEPTPMQLARYFHLDDTDKNSILIRRGNHNRLGFALQLVSVRFLGTFLENPIDVPSGVVIELATQLGISNIECLPQYLERPFTHWEHRAEIKQRYGYRDFSEQPGHWQLVRWLYGRAWVGSESPSVLFDLATARLVEHKVLLPGVTVLVSKGWLKLIVQENTEIDRRAYTFCTLGCNIGLKPLARNDIPALTRNRLAWIQQNYLRSETLLRANARLVDAQTQIPLAQTWGGGDVASADGLRFVVPVQTLNSGANRKYFGRGRGITYYNFGSDQFTVSAIDIMRTLSPGDKPSVLGRAIGELGRIAKTLY